MTKLGVIGDIHARWHYLAMVLDRIREVGVDGILLVGDLGSHDLGLQKRRTPAKDARYLQSIADVLDRVGQVGVPVLWVPGNHDLPDLEGPGNVDHGVATIGELRVAGIGGAGPDRFGFCYEWGDDEIRARRLPDCDVILAHCPPARTPLDQEKAGWHVGSEAIRERAEAQVGFLVCGHIHESPGATQLGDCLCMNVGGLGHPFGVPQVGFIERKGRIDRAWLHDLSTGEVHGWTRRVQ